jgi:hypothetical protein
MSKAAPVDLSLALPRGVRIAIVASRFNQSIVDNLLAGCQKRLTEIGMHPDAITVERVPGAMEIPVAAQALARTGYYSAVICLGCVIRGDKSRPRRIPPDHLRRAHDQHGQASLATYRRGQEQTRPRRPTRR